MALSSKIRENARDGQIDMSSIYGMIVTLSGTLVCSATSHDSKAELSSEVAMPQNKRPNSSTPKSLKCFVTHPVVYKRT